MRFVEDHPIDENAGDAEEFSLQEIKRESAAARKDYGYDPRRSQ